MVEKCKVMNDTHEKLFLHIKMCALVAGKKGQSNTCFGLHHYCSGILQQMSGQIRQHEIQWDVQK
jgi:hypothetical protein